MSLLLSSEFKIHAPVERSGQATPKVEGAVGCIGLPNFGAACLPGSVIGNDGVTMPGLSKKPSGENIDINEKGEIVGMF